MFRYSSNYKSIFFNFLSSIMSLILNVFRLILSCVVLIIDIVTVNNSIFWSDNDMLISNFFQNMAHTFQCERFHGFYSKSNYPYEVCTIQSNIQFGRKILIDTREIYTLQYLRGWISKVSHLALNTWFITSRGIKCEQNSCCLLISRNDA